MLCRKQRELGVCMYHHTMQIACVCRLIKPTQYKILSDQTKNIDEFILCVLHNTLLLHQSLNRCWMHIIILTLRAANIGKFKNKLLLFNLARVGGTKRIKDKNAGFQHPEPVLRIWFLSLSDS